ncbi:Helicase, C-terminal [Dillenia turbinata]|uniref:RNA helicase n=1 Tax=Dillenia turbinata TaxID=194707 RepID=A0AAN8ZFN8_9MAGN
MENSEVCVRGSLQSSLEGVDSNAFVLPAKKKNKNKKRGVNQGMGKIDIKKDKKLSKSQKRKLQKLEGETRLEKRRRTFQLCKVGLKEISNDQSCRGRQGHSAFSEIEYGSDDSMTIEEIRKDDFLRPVMMEKDVKRDSSALGATQNPVCTSESNGTVGPVNALYTKEVAEDISGGKKMQEVCGQLQMSPCYKDSKQMDSEHEHPVVGSSNGTGSTRALTTPMVVHVLRPNEVQDKRKDLPIVMMEQEIMEAINDHDTVIVCGETGCGKTTQVPQFLYEAGYGSRGSALQSGIVGVTQPRRVAVLATAKRVAYELGLHLGKEVGFQVRHDKRIGENCSIKFMTDGILLREVQNDFLLRRYSVLILDEAHERSLNTDILIGMLSRVIQVRQSFYEEQQRKILSGEYISCDDKISPLKLVLMSATLRLEDFIYGSRLFRAPPPVIEVPTRQFPVTVHFSKKTEVVDYIGQAYKKVLAIHKRLPPGGILVFVTGQREVEYLCKKLRKVSSEMIKKRSKGNVGQELTSVSEKSTVEGLDLKDINEAFESSTDQQNDRFSSYEEDHGDFEEDESDFSTDSGSDSELEVFGGNGDLLDERTSRAESNLVNLSGEDGSLASLKAAFEALSGRSTLDSVVKEDQIDPVAPEEQPAESNLNLGKKGEAENSFSPGAMCVLPLYAMLPAAAQLRVFEEVKEGERLVVVATNVAETSLTIPGIKYVVDTGREKVKKYNASSGIETYEIEWISKASAAQRAGRAGRTGPGHCYRLYSGAVFSNIFSDFSSAEILKVPVDGVVLFMKSMGISKVANFPFPTPPEAAALVDAERCLKTLEALDSQGRLTPLGQAMAQYPMSPRHSRMLLTVIQIMRRVKSFKRANLVLGHAIAAAAALCLPNPFIFQFEGNSTKTDGFEKNENSGSLDGSELTEKLQKMRKKELKDTAKASHGRFSNPSSDALTVAYALQCFELSDSQAKFCDENALHLKTMEEMSKLRKQLLELVFSQSNRCSQPEFSWSHGTMEDVQREWRAFSNKTPLVSNEEEILSQAICAGWADRVAKRTSNNSGPVGDKKVNAVRYQACMVEETVFLHRRSSLSKSAPEFLVYSELLHTKRPYIHGATLVKPDWLVNYARSLCSFSAPLTDPKHCYDPVTDQVLCWVTPIFGPHLWQLPVHSLPISNDVNRVAVFAYALLDGQVLPCLSSVKVYMAARPSRILRSEASGEKRVGNLLNKLKNGFRIIDCRAALREVWDNNPQELYLEVMDWFQEKFHNKFKAVWEQMHHEIHLEPEQLQKKLKKEGKRKSKLLV